MSTPQSISKVLIANRGEIAVRISQTLREQGRGVVALYSDADADALHVSVADASAHLPGVAPRETYLNIDAIVSAARDAHCDAVHPGYGFLSENADFARACAAAGLTFIGPHADVIATMGDKLTAKQTVTPAGVPTTPTSGVLSVSDRSALAAAANDVGFPVLLKAAAGGGGRGMRVVQTVSELQPAAAAAAREAASAFGDDRVFLEKYIERPRHIEVQVLGERDRILHCFERDCSIQRRHQKIIEEAPAPGLSDQQRAAIWRAGVQAASAVDYTNAGTIEFLLGSDGAFYFLEMNTRLQVEHPVTELITQRDLVAAQIAIASGQPLDADQNDVTCRGHAIECRIYAEDPANGFLPSSGRLERFRPPSGVGVRVDTGVREGDEVTTHYDAILAKLIVWGAAREQARRRMLAALQRFVVLGVRTNIDFLQDVLAHDAFAAGQVHTHFLEMHGFLTPQPTTPPPAACIAAALAATTSRSSRTPDALAPVESYAWNAGAWRNC